jgi:hypothetical protein
MPKEGFPKKSYLNSISPTMSILAQSSIILRFFNGFALTLDKWAAGSFLLGIFRERDSFPLWRGSLVLALLQFITAKIKILLEAIYTILKLSFQNSIAGKLYYRCIVPLKFSFILAVIDLLLAFIAANLIIRLALKAYAGSTLLVLTAGFLGFLLLRFNADKLQAAFRGSLLTRLLKWFFILEVEEHSKDLSR